MRERERERERESEKENGIRVAERGGKMRGKIANAKQVVYNKENLERQETNKKWHLKF